MLRMFYAELLKMQKSSIWCLTLVSPLLAALIGLGIGIEGPVQWEQLMAHMNITHSVLFLPLLAGIFSSSTCRFEHEEGGWKQLLAKPVSRGVVYTAKFLIVALLLMLTQLLFLAVLLITGWIKGFPGDIPWELFLLGVGGSLLASLPLAALQLFVSTIWSSFAAPMALNVIFTLPNILIVNSEKFAPYYPWAQPFLAAFSWTDKVGGLPVFDATLYGVVVSSFLLFFVSGFTYFQRKEV